MHAAGSGSESDSEEDEGDDSELDVAGERLNEVYERLQEVGSSTAEARAAKILHGLGKPCPHKGHSHTAITVVSLKFRCRTAYVDKGIWVHVSLPHGFVNI